MLEMINWRKERKKKENRDDLLSFVPSITSLLLPSPSPHEHFTDAAKYQNPILPNIQSTQRQKKTKKKKKKRKSRLPDRSPQDKMASPDLPSCGQSEA